MATFTDRYPRNTPGKYYIDAQCIDCDLCRECAPNNIQRDDEKEYSYVYRQPTTPEEIARCEEAVAGCPTASVGNDGDSYDWQTDDHTHNNDSEAPSPEPISDEAAHARVLGLRGRVTFADIKNHYRERMKEYHPDKVAALGVKLREVAESETKKINAAYEFFTAKYASGRNV